jgi:hypothetical protein
VSLSGSPSPRKGRHFVGQSLTWRRQGPELVFRTSRPRADTVRILAAQTIREDGVAIQLDYAAARRTRSTSPSQDRIRFQLALFWSTILRSRVLKAEA